MDFFFFFSLSLPLPSVIWLTPSVCGKRTIPTAPLPTVNLCFQQEPECPRQQTQITTDDYGLRES